MFDPTGSFGRRGTPDGHEEPAAQSRASGQPVELAPAALSPLSLDLFQIVRSGAGPRDARLTDGLTAQVVARAAARGPVDLRLAALLALIDVDRGSDVLGAALGEAGLLDAIAAIAHLEAHLGALRQRVVAALAVLAPQPAPARLDSPLASDAEQWAALTQANRASSLAARCGISPYLGGLALRRASDLVPGGRFRRIGQALEAGELPAAKAELIADELFDVADPLLARDVLDAVLPQARTLGVGRLRDAVRDEIARRRPADTQQAHDSAHGIRRVSRPRPVGLGLASMEVLGPAPEIAHLWSVIDAAARDARRSVHDEALPAMRFDAIVAIADRSARAHGQSTADDCPGEPIRRPSINVIVGIGTLAGSDDEPAELEGYGLIDARTARQLAADPTGTWRRLLVDEEGGLLSRGRAYRPPPSMAGYVLARDRTCRFPGCARTRLDLDHIVEFDCGGPTEPANLSGLCRTHHNLKTHRFWDYGIDSRTGDARWTDRHGATAMQPATRYRLPTKHARGAVLVRSENQRAIDSASDNPPF